MIVIEINSDVAAVERIRAELQRLIENPDALLTLAASTVLAAVAYRIHTEGRKADGSQIGVYDNAYLKVRQEKYNRTADRKMIFSLTRQMENDFTVVSEGGKIGLGFKNRFNLDKATWLEQSHPGVYSLSNDEERVVEEVIDDYLNGIFT